ncbi:MAG: sugar phosphate isomerase/epimerase [Clostridia bacterium]|nr:sugar phosphate isomerase/epimerase [Clostridia bacterium]
MHIGIRLHDTSGQTLEEHLQSARAQGFTCVHLALQKTIPGFSMDDAPALLTDKLAGEVKELLSRYGLSCAVLGCYLNLATPDLDAYRHTVDIYNAHLAFAAKIGATCVGTETGAPNTGYKTEPACWTDEALGLFIERVRPVVAYAESVGVPLAIEPVCRHIVSTPERAQRVLEAIPSEQLRIILDTVNLLTPENYPQVEEIIAESIHRFGDKILVLHMKDILPHPGLTDLMPVSRACGTGILDYTSLMRFAAKKDLPMTLEDTVPDNAEAARLFLEKTAAALK